MVRTLLGCYLWLRTPPLPGMHAEVGNRQGHSPRSCDHSLIATSCRMTFETMVEVQPDNLECPLSYTLFLIKRMVSPSPASTRSGYGPARSPALSRSPSSWTSCRPAIVQPPEGSSAL